MLTLFHAPDSRSSRLIWLLEELGAEFELVYCDIKRRSGRGGPDPGNPHPERRVPALMHGGQLVTETAAIALYLTDMFPAAAMGMPIGSPDRGAYLSWLAFYAGEADAIYNVRVLYEGRLDPFTDRDLQRVVTRVTNALNSGPYLLGDRFSAADILMSGPFEWDSGFAPGNAHIAAWLSRINARPATLRGIARDAPASQS